VATVGLTVTFRWRIDNRRPGQTYRSVIHLDKGPNACNGGIEESFEAGADTCLNVRLTPRRYADASLDFAIRVIDGSGNQVCVNDRPRIRVDPNLPSPGDAQCRTVDARADEPLKQQ
jgi:hypothetical protein